MLIPRRKIQVSHTETPLALAEMPELCHIPNLALKSGYNPPASCPLPPA